jgi:hypothetical protein
MAASAAPGANNRLQIPSLTKKEEFTRWYKAVAMLSQALGVRGELSDPSVEPLKMDAKTLSAFSQLVMAMTNSLSPTLYDVAVGTDEDEDMVLPFVIVAKLKAHFQPKYLLGDLDLRNKMYELKYEDFPSLTDYVLELQRIAKQVNDIEKKKEMMAKGYEPCLVKSRMMIGHLVRRLPREEYKITIDKIETDLMITFEAAVELVKVNEDKLKIQAGSSGSSSSSSTSINNVNTRERKGPREGIRNCSKCGNHLPRTHPKYFSRCDKCQEKWRKENKREKKDKPKKEEPSGDQYKAYIAYCEACTAAGQQPAPPAISAKLHPFADFTDLHCLDFVEETSFGNLETETPDVSAPIKEDLISENLLKEPRSDPPKPEKIEVGDYQQSLPLFDQNLPEIPPKGQPICAGEVEESHQTKAIVKVNNKKTSARLRMVGDSGCGRHASGLKDMIQNIRRTLHPVTVNLPDGRSYSCNLEGDMDAWVTTDHGPALIELHNVLYVEALDKSLVSLKCLAREGYEFRLTKDLVVITPLGHMFKVPQQEMDNIYYFPLTAPNNTLPTIRQSQLELFRLHLALGHPSWTELQRIVKALNITALMGKNLRNPNLVCSTCKVTKTTANPVPEKSPSYVDPEPFASLHFDNLVGLSRTPGGKTGYSFCVDRGSKIINGKLITSKTQSKDHIKEMHQLASSYGKQVRVIMSDSAPELFVDKELRKWLNERGTRNEASAPYAQYQNGYCETHVRIIMNMALSALITSGLPKSFWGEAFLWAIDTWNRTPHPALAWKTPLQTIKGHTPQISFLHPFGCDAFMRIPLEHQKKFSQKGERCILVGYEMDRKAYRLYNPIDKKVWIRSPRDVQFDDFNYPAVKDPVPIVSTKPELTNPIIDVEVPAVASQKDATIGTPPITLFGTPPIVLSAPAMPVTPPLVLPIAAESSLPRELTHFPGSWTTDIQSNPTSGTRSGTTFSANEVQMNFIDDDVDISYADQGARKHLEETYGPTPIKMEQALEDPDFRDATHLEVGLVKEMKTYHLVDPKTVPKGTPVHKPVMRWQRKFDGRAKCRWCFPGHRQRFGVDYNLTESPTAHFATWRAFVAYSQKRGAKIVHLDVVTAFLHGKVEEDVYMRQLPGFEDSEHPDWVCKLDGALYGMKQASRVFYQLAAKHFLEHGLAVNPKDPCHFFKFGEGDYWLNLVLFVDDMNVSGSEKGLDDFIRFISKRLKIKILGEMTRYAGVQITKDGNGVYYLCQNEDIKKSLARYGLDTAKVAPTPFDSSWTEIDEDESTINQSEFRSAVGSLFWFAMATRPDILSSVVIVSQFQEKPSKRAWTALKRIFRYLKGTVDQKLTIYVGEKPCLRSYSDASHGDPLLKRFSMTGSIHFYGNAPILWLSRKQRTPALSSAEAELIAASTTARDTLWLRDLLRPYKVNLIATLYVDNQATIAISQSEGLIRRVKHLEIHDLFVRFQVAAKRINIQYVATDLNLADLLTKGIKGVTEFKQKRDSIISGKRGRDI